MLRLRHPDTALIQSHLEQQSALAFSYRDVGATREASRLAELLPDEMTVDHNRVKLGYGEQTFEGAKRALRKWEMFNVDWVEFCWPSAPIEKGQTVGIMMRAGFLWSLNACRIVYLLDESGAERDRSLDRTVDRYGFAYGTLPDHAASGEERFLIEHDHSDDSVWYDLLAFSQPGGLATRINSRYARAVQRKFARHSLRAMGKATQRESSAAELAGG